MKDLIIIGAVLFVLWYAMRNGVFAQLGGGYAPPQSRQWFSAQTPWGNYGGGF